MNTGIKMIQNFNRFELKYILTMQQAKELKEQLKHYLVLDPYCYNSRDYVITSLYYDSLYFQCYWEKVDGIKFRKELRILFYETEDSDRRLHRFYRNQTVL